MIKLDIQKFADGKVVIDTDLNSSGFEKGLSKMSSIAKTGFKTVGIAVGAVSGAMAGALANGVKFNSEIERLQTSFEVMTGDADKAREVIQKLKDVGAKTPYELKGLASTTQLLMQYGFSADDAYDATVNLGDIAQGNAEKMESIALAFGQMSSLGRVTMQDIKQMINSGFNPLQAIAEMTGETMQEVNERYEQGAISVEEVTEAMRYASSENGRFFQSMEKQSKTLAGQISTLKDNFDSLTGTLSQGLSKTISGDVLPSINDLLQNMEEAFTKDGFSGLAEAAGKGIADMLTAMTKEAPKFLDIALLIVENLIKGIEENLPTITQSAIKLISNFTMAILKMLPSLLKLGMDLIVQLARGIVQQLPTLIPIAIDTILTLVDTLLDNIDLIIEAGIELIIALAEGLIDALPDLIDKIPIIIEKLLIAITENLPKLMAMGVTLIIKLTEGLIKAVPQLASKAPQIIVALVKALGSGFGSMAEVGANLVRGIWNGISNTTNWILSKIKGFGKSILNGIKKIFQIKSPSRVMRDQVGKFLAQGIGVGMEDELDNVYRDMQHAIDLQNAKMRANIETGNIFNTISHSTPVQIEVNADVEMDSQKVGRLITPAVSKTLKTGGAS